MFNLLSDLAVSLSHGMPYFMALWDSGFYQVMPDIMRSQPSPFKSKEEVDE